MSKSVKRVQEALQAAGITSKIRKMDGETRTAADAAREIGCEIDQIAKSIVFRGTESDAVVLFITSGGSQVDLSAAERVAGESLSRADATFVRERSGFAIGGVAPIAHKLPPLAFFDRNLQNFDTIYAAAGTPHHIFAVSPNLLVEISASQVSDFAKF